MPKVSIPEVDLNQISPWDGGSSMLPPGEYVFEIAECVVVPPKKADGSPQLEFDLVVQGGADSDQYNGIERKHWLSLAPKAAGRVRNMLDATGVQPEADGSFDSDLFKGTQFIAEVYEDTYQKADLTVPSGVREVVTNKIRKERPVSAGWSNGVETAPASAPASTPAPAPKAPAPGPTPKAPAPAPTPAPGSGLPRVTGAVPPRRPPVPPRRS